MSTNPSPPKDLMPVANSEETEDQKFFRRNAFRRLLRNYGNACYHDSMDEADEYEEEILESYDKLSPAVESQIAPETGS